MTINIKTLSSVIVAGVTLGVPAVLFAQGVGIPCEGPDCTFDDLVVLANNIVSFLIYKITIPLIAVAFAVIGANFIFNQNKEEARSNAKKQLESIAKGIFWIIAGFLIIKFILYQFLNTDAGFTLFLIQ